MISSYIISATECLHQLTSLRPLRGTTFQSAPTQLLRHMVKVKEVRRQRVGRRLVLRVMVGLHKEKYRQPDPPWGAVPTSPPRGTGAPAPARP